MKRVIAEVPETAIVSGPGRLGRGADDKYRTSAGPHASRMSLTNSKPDEWVTLIEI